MNEGPAQALLLLIVSGYTSSNGCKIDFCQRVGQNVVRSFDRRDRNNEGSGFILVGLE